MNAKRNIIMWGVFIALALVLSLFFTSPEFEPNNKLIALPFALPILGDTISEFVAIGLLAVVVVGAVIGAGLPIVFLYRMLDTTTAGIANNDQYKAGMQAIASRQSDEIKVLAKAQPAGKAPSHDESNWTAISTALTLGFLFSLIGAAFSDNFMGGTNQANVSWWFAAVGLLTGFLTLNRNRVRTSDESQSNPIDWGMIFIVLTGILVVGLGIGVMMWVRSQTA